ncbi:MAG: toprim domain-containing protein [Methylococcales bacterium]
MKANIEQLRQLDLILISSRLGLEQDQNDSKQFKSDSYRISLTGQKWFDHNANIGGGGAIDLTMHIKQITFTNAVNWLTGVDSVVLLQSHNNINKKLALKQKKSSIPIPNANNLQMVKNYLTSQRGLNADLVQWCITKGLIYADSRSNCVFMYGVRGAELRGTDSIVQWRSIYGTIEHGFILPAQNAQGVALLESAIDALSYRQLHRKIITCSMAGNSNHTVMNQAVFIAKANNLPVLSAFDADKGGDIANTILSQYAALNGVKIVQDRPIQGKDWNDVLLSNTFDSHIDQPSGDT